MRCRAAVWPWAGDSPTRVPDCCLRSALEAQFERTLYYAGWDGAQTGDLAKATQPTVLPGVPMFAWLKALNISNGTAG